MHEDIPCLIVELKPEQHGSCSQIITQLSNNKAKPRDMQKKVTFFFFFATGTPAYYLNACNRCMVLRDKHFVGEKNDAG